MPLKILAEFPSNINNKNVLGSRNILNIDLPSLLSYRYNGHDFIQNQSVTRVFLGRMNITLLVPVHNEEDNIRPFYLAVNRAFEDTGLSYDILFVDDGSTDRSLGAIRELAGESPRVRFLAFDRNYGKTAALDAGFKNARGDIIVTIDCDLQYHPEDCLRLIKELDDPEVSAVFGARTNSASGFIKRLSSRIAQTARNAILGDIYRGSSLAAYRRDCLAGLTLYDGFEVFMPPLLWQRGFKSKEIPVPEHPRQRGISKHGIRNRLFQGFFGLLILRWMRRHRMRYQVTDRHDGTA